FLCLTSLKTAMSWRFTPGASARACSARRSCSWLAGRSIVRAAFGPSVQENWTAIIADSTLRPTRSSPSLFCFWRRSCAEQPTFERTHSLIALKHFLPGVASLLLTAFAAQAAPETVIWFDTPATNFTASCPLGNGRLGAMMFGGIDHERVVLNESSVWSGSPQDSDRPDAYKVLPEIRRLLLAGKNTEAEALVNANFTCQGPGSAGPQWGCYQVLGNLHLDFQYSHPAA